MKLNALKAACTIEFHHPFAKAVWTLRGMLLALAVYAVFVPEPAYTDRWLLLVSAASGFLASLAFAFIPTDRPRTLKAAEAAILAALMAHVGGHAFGIYARFSAYDNVLHFILPLVAALAIYALSQATDWIWDWRRVKPSEVAIYLFALTVTVATMWEIIEFSMDSIFGTREQDNLHDTMLDLILGVVGGVIGAVVAGWSTWFGRTRGHHRVSEEKKRPRPSRAPTPTSQE